MADARTAWRTTTTSSDEAILSGPPLWNVLRSMTAMVGSVPVGAVGAAQELHAFIDVQCRPDAGQPESELHQGDRDRGPHADDDGLRVEHPGHRGDVAEHPADEGVDDL